MNPWLAAACRRNFGVHAQYFLLNYAGGVPPGTVETAARLLSTVPQGVRCFGVHLRYHCKDSLYSRSVNESFALAGPFCQAMLKRRPTIVVLASDSAEIMGKFRETMQIIETGVKRQTDGPLESAVTDLAIIMMCQEWLLTARSTFSATIGMRVARGFWMIEKYATAVYRVEFSQIGHQETPMFLPDRASGSELSCMATLRAPGAEETVRFFWKYFVV